MPKSDTWPGGVGLEMMISSDSAGSCDSVVSANSGCSDDSLEHLSAEEKACLLFLEETIESLDTEEDSGLSNDEPDQLPNPGSLATKLADLSDSINQSKLNGSHKLASKELEENIDTQPVQSYFVPTPLVVASSSPYSVPSAMPSVPLDKNLRSQPHITASSKTPDHKHNQKPAAPQVTLEVNVVIPPPTKPRDFLARTAEVPLPRGPLSYEALVHLRKSASTKKTPLCPSVDHTIELEKHLPLTVEVLKPGSDRAHSQAPISKTGHPAVAPKPKKITPNISAKTPNEAAVTSDSLYKVKNATDPQVVRLEALQKLGLRKGQQSENETVGPLPPPKSHSSFDLSRSTRGPSYVNPSRSPSFCDSQVPSEPKHGPLQSSASFHHGSRWDQQPGSVSRTSQSNGLKAASLERSATLDNHLNAPIEPPHAVTATKPMKTTSAAEPVPHQASNAVGYTVMVVPGMGTDRKEALRKLGLLKN